MNQVLVEISGGVLTNVVVVGDTPVKVWLRDYDNLREKGMGWLEAQEHQPELFHSYEPAGFSAAPKEFTGVKFRDVID